MINKYQFFPITKVHVMQQLMHIGRHVGKEPRQQSSRLCTTSEKLLAFASSSWRTSTMKPCFTLPSFSPKILATSSASFTSYACSTCCTASRTRLSQKPSRLSSPLTCRTAMRPATSSTTSTPEPVRRSHDW